MKKLRHWLDESAVRPQRHISARSAWTIVVVGYLLAFGWGLVRAIQVFNGGELHPAQTWSEAAVRAIRTLLEVGVSVAAAVVVLRLTQASPYGLRLRRLPGEALARSWHRELAVGTILTMVAALTFVIATFAFDMPDFPQEGTGWVPEVGLGFFTSLCAGFKEEPLFTLAIPLALIASGRSVLFAATVSALLRVAFHIYYGCSCLALFPWAFLAVIFVLRTGCIVGVTLMHSLYDVVVSGNMSETSLGALVALVGTIGILYLIAWWWFQMFLPWVTGKRPTPWAEDESLALIKLGS